jgi:hypothetical protein
MFCRSDLRSAAQCFFHAVLTTSNGGPMPDCRHGRSLGGIAPGPIRGMAFGGLLPQGFWELSVNFSYFFPAAVFDCFSSSPLSVRRHEPNERLRSEASLRICHAEPYAKYDNHPGRPPYCTQRNRCTSCIPECSLTRCPMAPANTRLTSAQLHAPIHPGRVDYFVQYNRHYFLCSASSRSAPSDTVISIHFLLLVIYSLLPDEQFHQLS